MPPAIEANIVVEELFCSGTVKYYDQPVGVVVASSYAIARKAVDKVKIYFDPPKQKPLVTVRDVLKAGATNRVNVLDEIKASKTGLYILEHHINNEVYYIFLSMKETM